MSNTPVASGSRVPECPTFFVCRMPRNLATTSCDVHPASLSTTTSPSSIEFVVVAELVEVTQDLFDARGLAFDLVDAKGEERRALHTRLTGDRLLQRDAVLGEPGEHLLVALRPRRGVDVDGGVAQIRFDHDAHHGDEVEALVVDPFDLLG